MKKVMFIASAGGHLTELLKLKKVMDKYDSYLVTEKSKSTINLSKEYKVSFLMAGTKKNLYKYIPVCIYNLFKSIYLFIKIRPNVIITTGVHTSVIMCYLGYIFRKKVIYIETFANINTKTLTGKLIYPIASLFIVQWDSMKKLYPKAVVGGSIF